VRRGTIAWSEPINCDLLCQEDFFPQPGEGVRDLTATSLFRMGKTEIRIAPAAHPCDPRLMTSTPATPFAALLAILAAASAPATPAAPPVPGESQPPRMVRVAILCGQSNMAGGSKALGDTTWPRPWLDMTSVTDQPNTAWQGLKMPSEGGDGVQAGVAEVLQAAFPDDRIAIVKVSQGATGISFWSNPGSAGREALITRLAAAKARLETQAASGEIQGFQFVGFLYMQGEAEMDAWNTESTRRYFQQLQRLASAVRACVGKPELPVVLGRTGSYYAASTIRTAHGNRRVFPVTGTPKDRGFRPFAKDSEFLNSDVLRGHVLYEGYSDAVRTAQIGWTLYDKHSAWAEADDFELGDYFHFGEGDPGKVTLGRRMARAALRLNGMKADDELVLSAGPHRWVHAGKIRLAATITSGPASPAKVEWKQLPVRENQPVAEISATNALETDVSIPEPGTYAFRIEAVDGQLRHAQTVNIYALPPEANLPAYGSAPIHYAPRPGAPVTLKAEVVNPDNDLLTYTWKAPYPEPHRRFGQGQAVFSSTNATNPTVVFTWPGAQIVRLEISDGTKRDDGNASGWINVPVFVGAGDPDYPEYSARWGFEEKDFLLAEVQDLAPRQENRGVVQAGGGAVGTHCARFDGRSHLRNHVGHWDSGPIFLRPYGNFTLSLWAKPDAASEGPQVLYEEGGSSKDSALTLRTNAGKLEAALFEAGTLHTLAAPAPEAGRWTHVAFSFDGANREMKLWVDGREAASAAVPFDKLSKRSMASAIGARLEQDAFNATGGKDEAADFFTGSLDEVRLYEKALDADAIGKLRAAGAGTAP